jgi:hypothetical protein
MEVQLRAELRALIDELNREIAQPIDALDREERVYEMGVKSGKRQVIYSLETLLGTPGYRRSPRQER